MEIAILGLKQSGKSTLFQIMTGVISREIYGQPVVRGIAKVPDKRFSRLVDIFQPEKITPATIPFIDINSSGEGAWDEIRQMAGNVDSIIHIVDCHTTSDVSETIERYKTIEDELIISDLIIVERRIERLVKIPPQTLRREETIQARIMPVLKAHLESGRSLRDLKLSGEEKEAVKNFSFWSQRPEVVVLNTAEGMSDPSDKFRSCTTSPVLSICCQIEAEIASLAENERKGFLDSIGIVIPAFETIIQTAFSQLERICYFTVGKDEVRAWVIKKGSTAPQAAAAIHKDFERGFIKAEVVSYLDFIATGNTLTGAKSAGRLKLEGKDYVVQDGDIISFRFNV